MGDTSTIEVLGGDEGAMAVNHPNVVCNGSIATRSDINFTAKAAEDKKGQEMSEPHLIKCACH